MATDAGSLPSTEPAIGPAPDNEDGLPPHSAAAMAAAADSGIEEHNLGEQTLPVNDIEDLEWDDASEDEDPEIEQSEVGASLDDIPWDSGDGDEPSVPDEPEATPAPAAFAEGDEAGDSAAPPMSDDDTSFANLDTQDEDEPAAEPAYEVETTMDDEATAPVDEEIPEEAEAFGTAEEDPEQREVSGFDLAARLGQGGSGEESAETEAEPAAEYERSPAEHDEPADQPETMAPVGDAAAADDDEPPKKRKKFLGLF